MREALVHLLSLSGCLVVRVSGERDLVARRLLARPHLRSVGRQVEETVEWLNAATLNGERLEFCSARAQEEFSAFVAWARHLRHKEAALLGLQALREAAFEFDTALKTAGAPPPVVVLPVYELPQSWREPLRMAG